jgi:hypothetical protein
MCQWNLLEAGSGTLESGWLGHIYNEAVNERLQEGKSFLLINYTY